MLQLFRERLSHEPLLTFNPGVIVGGTAVTFDREQSRGTAGGKGNVIAAQAIVEGDVRAISPEQLASAKAAMQAIVADALPHTTSTIEFDDSYPPLAPTDGNRRLLSMYDQASRDIGAGPVAASDPRAAGAADISFTAGRVEMALDGIGLMGRNDHSEHETADLATLPSQTKRAAVLIYRLTHAEAVGRRRAVTLRLRSPRLEPRSRPRRVARASSRPDELRPQLLVVRCVDAPQPS